ncbi:MAG TPA: polyprenyl synthetase family protein [Paracoccaceae bacterium]|nr:polyprenyl synthetase family protein [Paracoccaceae bacterium]
MDPSTRIDKALRYALSRAGAGEAPPKLSAAMRHAVFPGGARVRPMLCLAVAGACGDDQPALAEASAASLELMHCASLVHDDLPCFDDAEVRRGRPTVHAAYSEPLAVLAGDALIVLAFETLARAGGVAPARLAGLVAALAKASGSPSGICAGQGWESEEKIALGPYHQAKTGALFVAACTMGALSAGREPGPWAHLGDCLGEAYQVADDLRDALLSEAELGKPAGQDETHGRPSAVAELGVRGAVSRLEALLREAVLSIPDCPGHATLEALVMAQAKRLVPSGLEAATA